MATGTDNAGLRFVFFKLPVRGAESNLYTLPDYPTIILFNIYNIL